ncbi:NAD(P)H-dependent oxidoreductase [Thermodesulfobacteriota bacterium]
MKVLALNSSPRGGGQSKTEWMLNHLAQGLEDAGARVETIDLRKMKIDYCVGCFTCWTKTPGTCIQKDDMTRTLYPKWLESDMVVYATPLYHFTMNAQMKTFVERTLPILQPFFKRKGGKTYHPLRHRFPDAVWLSVAGFPEASIYEQLSSYLNFLYGKQLLAELYRPAAESVVQPAYREVREKIAEAVQQAGRELVESKTVSAETMAQITQPIDDPESIAAVGNSFWKTCIAEGVTPRAFEKKGMIPRPDSVESFMAIMKMGFNQNAVIDKRAVMQFKFSGSVEAACYFTIETGSVAATKGLYKNPDITIETPFDVWMDIMTKKVDGQEMFMQQKYRVDGDFAWLMRMGELFGG